MAQLDIFLYKKYKQDMGKVLKNFIVFEGLDGAGQSTQATLLAKALEKMGKKVLLTKEPTNNLIGGLIRGALTREWNPSNQILQLLYAADRGHHLEREILPALKRRFIVICDRYLFSSLAFGSLDVDYNFLKSLNSTFPLPEKAFYISVSPKTSLQRIGDSRFEMELFEKEQKLKKISETYEKLLIEFLVLKKIDGERSIEKIHNKILKQFNFPKL